MDLRNFLKRLPIFPLTAIIFYLAILLLWTINLIPSPNAILVFLENLYKNYGLMGLFIATFLEGIVYLGLYFPGSLIIVLSVILSDGSFISLFSISIVVASALTLTSLINYFLGKHIIFRQIKEKDKLISKFSKGLILASLLPNALAFYFFNLGIKKRNPLKILYVPIIMIPYGLMLAYIFSSLRFVIKEKIENPYILISVILIWFIVAFIFEYRKKM